MGMEASSARNMNFIERIRELALRDPERVALVRCDLDGKVVEEISRKELLQKITETAAALQTSAQPGERIALATGATIDTLILSWAAWAAGVVTVPLDTKRDTEEMREYKLSLSNAKITFDALPKPSANEVVWAPTLEHEAIILFTSGTTARAKGASLSLANMVVNADSIAQWLHITADDRFLVVLPLHHINSTTFCLSALLAGASIAVLPQYSNSRFWQQAAHSGATLTSVVPSIVFDQLARTSEYTAVKSELKLTRIQLGSAPVVASAAEQFIEQFHIPLYQGYGQTETALRVTGVPVDLSSALYAQMLQENSIGTPLSWAQVEIQDESGKALGENEEGEMVVKGPAIMRGYLAGEEAFRDGWFLTGDIGYWRMVEGRKFFFLKGRKKEIIIKGGVNISPVAVENSLQKISSDITQAYVIGAPEERHGEEIAAVIVWKPDVDVEAAMRRLKLKLILGTPEISGYETPQYLCSIDATQLPMTSTGKVQRTILKDTLQGELKPLTELFSTDEFCFTQTTPHSPLFAASLALYNHCWEPLTQNEKEYETYLKKYLTLGAIDAKGMLQGQISTEIAEDTLTCVSICSANFKPKSIPVVTKVPTPDEVRDYVLGGYDPVYNFHQKLGAALVEVIPNGRPEDASALGYTMLLKYPSEEVSILSDTPISNQLIATARILGRDMNAEVFALSRPGGLAAYLARTS